MSMNDQPDPSEDTSSGGGDTSGGDTSSGDTSSGDTSSGDTSGSGGSTGTDGSGGTTAGGDHADAQVRNNPQLDTSQASIGTIPSDPQVAMAEYPKDFGTAVA